MAKKNVGGGGGWGGYVRRAVRQKHVNAPVSVLWNLVESIHANCAAGVQRFRHLRPTPECIHVSFLQRDAVRIEVNPRAPRRPEEDEPFDFNCFVVENMGGMGQASLGEVTRQNIVSQRLRAKLMVAADD